MLKDLPGIAPRRASSRPEAKVIADSISEAGYRLTTMVVKCHRFVLSEFNTHRAFSRNSASSRAIPFAKQLDRVMNDPAIPLVFPQEKAGMQGGAELDGWQREQAEREWLGARDGAAHAAENLARLGVHKSVVNRLVEPFMWHTIVVSSTEWENFFVQRCSPLAMPEMLAVASAMEIVLAMSQPKAIGPWDWHTPFMSADDIAECEDRGLDARHVSAARCARVSYLTHDGVRDLAKDIELYERLTEATPPHASPLEHVATPASFAFLGNFRGFRQLRHEVLDF